MLIALRILVALPGLLFVLNGLRWAFDPEAMAAALGMPLLSGAAASSQIGDMGSFFLVGGVLILWGVRAGASQILYAPALLIGGAALYRSLAALLGYADWAWNFIGIEIAMVAILFLGAHYLPRLEGQRG